MTILATGFTMDDIPLIADKRRNEAAQMTEEELRLEEERIEKERKERDLIGKYYGAYRTKGGSFYLSWRKAVVLTQEELDDDALIALIEDNPTYNRDPKIVARARSKERERIFKYRLRQRRSNRLTNLAKILSGGVNKWSVSDS